MLRNSHIFKRAFSVRQSLAWPNEDFFERNLERKGLIDNSQFLLVRHAESQANLAFAKWDAAIGHLKNTLDPEVFAKRRITDTLLDRILRDAALTERGIE